MMLVLSNRDPHFFPWKSIWRVNVATKVAFFTWTTAKRKILTMDNLQNRNICVVELCCMCKKSWESKDHLLLRCDFANNLWSLLFWLFGLHWFMLKRVLVLLACWKERVARHCSADLWGQRFHHASCGLFGENTMNVLLKGLNIHS